MKDRLGRMGQAALAPHSPGQRSGNPWARAALPEEKPGLDYIKDLPSSRWGRIGHLKTIFWLWKTLTSHVSALRTVRNQHVWKEASHLLSGQQIFLSSATWEIT